MISNEKSTGVVIVRGQRFAAFGRLLADLTPFTYDTPRGVITCEPVADSHGRYTATFPDEGRSSLECRFTYADGRSHIGDGPFRWIFADEAKATNAEINERTAEMLDNGNLTMG